MNNPYFEDIYKYSQMGDPVHFRKANLLIGYHLNIDNKYDLDVIDMIDNRTIFNRRVLL